MKKVVLTSVLLGSVLLTGCQSMGTDTDSIANVDFNSMSCSEIKQYFVDYKDKMDTLDSSSGLLSMVGMGGGAETTKATMATAYSSAREVANPIMKVKKCSESI
ncbi:hypothetical protein V6238_17040 [Marinomonas arenicola]|uniref:hypothetical protein n=1 Tax=Marinomonas TaxID=28253 RepID=UPI00311DB125